MPRVIKPAELQKRGTVALARWLLGKALVRTIGDAREAYLITEVEAYDGERDRACHASKGRTKRTEVMYQTGGAWYVYLWNGIELDTHISPLWRSLTGHLTSTFLFLIPTSKGKTRLGHTLFLTP